VADLTLDNLAMTWVLSKHGDQWLIDAVQNTVWSADPAKAPKVIRHSTVGFGTTYECQ